MTKHNRIPRNRDYTAEGCIVSDFTDSSGGDFCAATTPQGAKDIAAAMNTLNRAMLFGDRWSIPMILRCPSCNERHIDEGPFADMAHHTHACQHCGTCWRPAIVATMGVQFLPDFKNP